MKIISITILLLAFTITHSSSVVSFGEAAVNAIFKEKKDAVILFSSQNSDSEAIFSAAAEADNTQRIYTLVDQSANSDHFKRFAEYLGVDVSSTPVLAVLRDAKNKYIASAQDFSEEGIAAFISRVEAGEVGKLLKSAPIPENNDTPVKTFVGKNYKSTIFESDNEFLVKFYAPWCGHCKTIAPEYVAAAEALAGNSKIVLAEVDGTLNEVEGVDISGFPTIFWYGKDKSVGPIQYNGGRDKAGIITWIKEHTEHEWVEPESESEEKGEEEL